jgi:hypothetical protein
VLKVEVYVFKVQELSIFRFRSKCSRCGNKCSRSMSKCSRCRNKC